MDNEIHQDIKFTYKKSIELINEISKIVIGQNDFIKKLVICLLSGGHILIEGVPGVAKTLSAKTLSRAINSDFKRIQFTPDLMPADVFGTKVYDIKTGNFYFRKGPIFTNLLLADEINRTPPKTQSALLEAMEEKTITIDGQQYELKFPFMVLATQNPLEYEGTYPLPEAQLDRFMMKAIIDYLPQSFENKLLKRYNKGLGILEHNISDINVVLSEEDLKRCQLEINNVNVRDTIIEYITAIISSTRNSQYLLLGGSTRATICILVASRTLAVIEGRNYVIPEDVKDVVLPVLRHRIIVKPEVSIEGVSADDVVRKILNQVEVPR